MRERTKASSATKTLMVAEELRARLEGARLDLRALFRALDRLHLTQDLPAELRCVLELDADFAEALRVLGQPPGAFDLTAMTRDTGDSLERLPAARKSLLALFDSPTRQILEQRVRETRGCLLPEDAYLEIAGRGPSVQ